MKRLFIVFALLFTSVFCFGEDIYNEVDIGDSVYVESTKYGFMEYILSSIEKIDKDYYYINISGLLYDEHDKFVCIIPLQFKLKKGDKLKLRFYSPDIHEKIVKE